MKKIGRAILQKRNELAQKWTRNRLPDGFTIISDDCWGGQIYRQLGIPYQTPTVGLYIDSATYLDFVTRLSVDEACDLVFIDSEHDFPVALYGNTLLYFMHYKSQQDAAEKFARRYRRMNRNRFFVKVDLGKPEVTERDIESWNSASLPNSVAFYSHKTKVPLGGIHNGVLVKDWTQDGAKMFDVSRRYFDVVSWIRDGHVGCGISYRVASTILYDPTSPKRIGSRLISALKTAVGVKGSLEE